MLNLLETGERQTQGVHSWQAARQCFSLMESVRGGVKSERGERAVKVIESRGALSFHVLPRPPQFADKGRGCQGDSTEKGKVSAILFVCS